MKSLTIPGFISAVFMLAACDNTNEKLNAVTTVESQFQTTIENWAGGFAGISTVADTTKLDTLYARARLPVALDSTKYGLRIIGRNRKNDNLFMFFKKKIIGLIPNRDYKIVFQIDLGTSYPDNVGGNSVYLKAGASPNEPVRKLEGTTYTISIDKGQKSESGKEMVVLGNVSNGQENQAGYRLISRSNQDNPVTVKANSQGQIWLCVGSDSNYKGETLLFYDRIKATITEQITN